MRISWLKPKTRNAEWHMPDVDTFKAETHNKHIDMKPNHS